MSNLNITVPENAKRHSIVNVIDGEAMADSRDVAAYFERNHKDVLRTIDALLSQEPDLALRNFVQGSYKLQATGEQMHRHFRMTRDGFVLLAMGFTGSKALWFKLAYIEAFNAMEAELRARPPVDPQKVLNDPAAMRGLLLTYRRRCSHWRDRSRK